MITILHLCEHFGGKSASLHGVAKAFGWWLPEYDATRFRVLLCSRKGRDAAYDQMCTSGIKPLTLGFGKMDPRNLWRLIRLIKKERVDLIHAHGFGACTWGRLAGHLLGLPVIVHGRANYSQVPLLQRPVERILGPITKYAFAVSDSTRQFMIRKRYIPEQVIRVQYNGILLDRIPKISSTWIAEFRNKMEVQDGMSVLGMVGRLVIEQKGHLDALLAMRELLQRGCLLQLWIIGDGDDLETLQQKTRELDLTQYVKFLGFQKNVLEIIQCFDIQLFPSRFEGTPNTLFEALAVGNAIIATPVDGQGEILEDGKTALLHPPCGVGVLVEKCFQLLTDKALKKQLEGNALARSRDFDGKNSIRAMEDFYTEIMETQANQS